MTGTPEGVPNVLVLILEGAGSAPRGLDRRMSEALLYLISSFWLGAVHAATPGHGKTISAAYIVGARGRPADALILGIFVTLSHISGIVFVAVLASLGLPGLIPQRVEAYLALFTGVLVVVTGLWMLLTRRSGLSPDGIFPGPVRDHDHSHGQGASHDPDHGHVQGHGHALAHDHDHPHDPAQGPSHPPAPDHTHDHDPQREVDHPLVADLPEHGHREELGYHSHGWGVRHTHRVDVVTQSRPKLIVLLGLGIAGGLLPDPAALAILLSALANGKVVLGLGTVLVFSLGFASTLVIVGVAAAKVGQAVLAWLSGPWAARIQTGTAWLIVAVGVILTANAWRTVSALH